MSKKGFTLVELLAVIVILAVILVIAVPKITDVIEKTKRSTFINSAATITALAERRLSENQILEKNENITCEGIVNLTIDDYKSCSIEFENEEAYLTLIGKGKFENMAICEKTKNNIQISEACTRELSINLNGGIMTNNPSGAKKIAANISLEVPTRENYTFAGWEIESGKGSVSGNTLVMGAEDTTIKALWIPTEYNIEYALNGGDASNPSSYNVESSSITLANPTRENYTFDGWTGSNGSTVETTVTISTGSGGNKSYTANWTPIPYDITYTLNGGDATNPISYNVESNITLTNPTKPAYTFTGWTGSNGSTKQTSVTISPGSTGPKSYTANWTPTSYDITYTLDGGSATNPTSYDVESNITLTNPTKPAYTFTGWTGSNGSTKQTSVTISPGSTGPKSYTANWTPTPFTISYNCNGGQGSTASHVWTHGTTSILSANGCYKITAGSAGMVYYLKGWAKTSTATTALFTDKQNITNSAQITSNITLYAVWGTLFTITGNYEVINDGTYNWRLKIKGAAGYTYGTASITFNNTTSIDIFAVGGGAGGGANWSGDIDYAGGGGGSGYTKTYKEFSAVKNTAYDAVVGDGGAGGTSGTDLGKVGGQSYFYTTAYKADGGLGIPNRLSGSSGGSGGGSGGYRYNWPDIFPGGVGGIDGGNGSYSSGGGPYGIGTGQGTTTREFGEASGTLYAQGGSGGWNSTTTPQLANSGNGGNAGIKGSSGIVILRNHR